MFDSEEHYGRVFYVPGNHEPNPQKTMQIHSTAASAQVWHLSSRVAMLCLRFCHMNVQQLDFLSLDLLPSCVRVKNTRIPLMLTVRRACHCA